MKITQYLKNNSHIDHKFIDDIFWFYDVQKTEFDFTIDISNIQTILNIDAQTISKLLSYFENGRDFIANNNTILITYDCFKIMCFVSTSNSKNKVRNNCIELEKLLINLFRPNNGKKGCIYIIKSSANLIDLHKYKNFNVVLNKCKKNECDAKIVFAYKCDNICEIEKNVTKILEKYNCNKIKDIHEINLDVIKELTPLLSKSCKMIKHNKKALWSNGHWILFIN